MTASYTFTLSAVLLIGPPGRCLLSEFCRFFMNDNWGWLVWVSSFGKYSSSYLPVCHATTTNNSSGVTHEIKSTENTLMNPRVSDFDLRAACRDGNVELVKKCLEAGVGRRLHWFLKDR